MKKRHQEPEGGTTGAKQQRKTKATASGVGQRATYHGHHEQSPFRLEAPLRSAARLSPLQSCIDRKHARYGTHLFHHSERTVTSARLLVWMAYRGLQINLRFAQGLNDLANHVATRPLTRGYWALTSLLTMPEPTSPGENNATTFRTV
jgi:hypothetical protein